MCMGPAVDPSFLSLSRFMEILSAMLCVGLLQTVTASGANDKSPVGWLPLPTWNDVVSMSAELEEVATFASDVESSAVRFKEVRASRWGVSMPAVHASVQLAICCCEP